MTDLLLAVQDKASYIGALFPALLQGTIITIKLFICTLVLSMPLGLPLALGSGSRIAPIRWICKLYILVFRGTPLLLQLFFFYYSFAIIWEVRFSAFTAAVISFVLNYAAYFAEIYRGGMNSIDKGQYEAAHSLGLSKRQTLFDIILPQTMRVVLPPVSNEAIILVKDTALASTITLLELMRVAQGAVNRDVDTTAFLLAASIYLVLTLCLTLFSNYLERRFSKYDEKGER